MAITFAIVNVLPVPVAPRSTCADLPELNPFVNASIAEGWSPAGENG